MWSLPHVAPFYEGIALRLLLEFITLSNNARHLSKCQKLYYHKTRGTGFPRAWGACEEAAVESSRGCLLKTQRLSLDPAGKWPGREPWWPCTDAGAQHSRLYLPPDSFSCPVLCPPTGNRLGFTMDSGKFHNVSLGQGQEAVAEMALETASQAGHWVILQVSALFSWKTLDLNTGSCPATGNDPSSCSWWCGESSGFPQH